MPLPLASCADDVPTDVCCTSVFDIADRIREVAYDGLCGKLDPSCRDREFRTYVSIGPRVPEPLGDALVVYINPDVTPSPGSRRPGGTLLGASLQRAPFEIYLTENGWPTPETNEIGEVIYVPPSDLIHAISRHAYSHGEAMYRAVLNAVQRRTLFPVEAFPHIAEIEITGLRAVAPSSHTVGWIIPITVQLTFPPT